jgi:aryl-alcohol dehydrogenase-like predicted oxidoreductase
LGLGTLTFGREADERTSATILDTFLEAGGNLIDTADSYHVSEDVLGRILGDRRGALVLATKVGLPVAGGVAEGTSRVQIIRQCERSLRRLRTEWIDLYHLHAWDPATPLEETLSTLDDLVRVGKVRYVGASNWSAWQIAKAIGIAALHEWEPLVSLTPEYSLVERSAERELLPMCISERLAVLPWSPLGGGLLSGKYHADAPPPDGSRADQRTNSTATIRRRLSQARYLALAECVRLTAANIGRAPSQVALNWVMHRAGVTAPIIGVRNTEQLIANLGASGWRLEPDDEAALDDVSAIDLGYPHEWNARFGIRQGPRPDRQVEQSRVVASSAELTSGAD